MKLCVIYNFGQKYREGIFKKIEKEYDCEWYFGSNNTDIKELDESLFSSVHNVKNKVLKGSFYWQENVSKLIRRGDLDNFLILGELYCLSTWWLLIQKKLIYKKKKIYLWSHGWYGKETWIRKILKKIFFGMADGVFLYGNYARNLMVKEGFAKDKLFVIHNSLDYEKQVMLRDKISQTEIYNNHFGNNWPNIIFIGRLTNVKRLDLLIEALDILKKRSYNVNVTLIGDGEASAELKDMVDKFNLKDRVWFYGSCYDDTENAELINNADVCVSPGNVGLTAMHSLVFGTPVITHNNLPMQMPEFEAIVEGKTGSFFKYDNSDSLARTITEWLDDAKDQREMIRTNCYKEIDDNWTPEFQLNILKNEIGK